MSDDQLFHYMSLKKSSGTAIAIELLAGSFLAIFGLGNFYAGNPLAGVLLLISYWVIQGINILLMFVIIGFFTFPLVWLIYMVVASLLAHGAVEKHNRMLAARLGVAPF